MKECKKIHILNVKKRLFSGECELDYCDIPCYCCDRWLYTTCQTSQPGYLLEMWIVLLL